LNFDITAHVGDARSSYSIPVPSLKFIDLPFKDMTHFPSQH